MSRAKFRMGRLDHVHIHVPDRDAAARWYAEHLGFEPVKKFDLCWAYNMADPWGNQYELNCYDYERVKTELIEANGVEPVRYWPRERYAGYQNS